MAQAETNYYHFLDRARSNGSIDIRQIPNERHSDTVNRIFKYVVSGRQFQQGRAITSFWMFDYKLDYLSEAMIRAVTDSHIDKIKTFRIDPYQGNQIAIFPVVVQNPNVVQNVEFVAQIVRTQYQIGNPDIALESDMMFQRMMGNMVQQMWRDRSNIIYQLMRSEFQNVDPRFIATDNSKNLVSVQCAMKFAGISDMEFIKMTFIYNIMYTIGNQMNNQLGEYMVRNSSWLIIYFASIMQMVDIKERRNKRIQMGSEYFEKRIKTGISEIDREMIRNSLGVRPTRDQDNLMIQSQFQYDIRTPFVRAFQNVRDEIQQIGILQGRNCQDLTAYQRLALDEISRMQENQGMESEFDQRDVDSYLYGKLFDILTAIYVNKLNEYKALIQNRSDDLRIMIVPVTIIIQVPILSRNNVQIDNYNNSKFNEVIGNPRLGAQDIQDQQYDTNRGWSGYYTIYLQQRYNSFEAINLDPVHVSLMLRRSIVDNIVGLIQRYDQAENLNGSVIANGFVDMMIRSIKIRPISLFRNQTMNELQQIQATLDIQQRQINQIVPNQQFNFDQEFPQFRASSRLAERNVQQPAPRPQRAVRQNPPPQQNNQIEPPVRPIGRRVGSLFSQRDYEMEKRFNDINIETQFDNCCQRAATAIQSFSPSLKDEAPVPIQDIHQLLDFIHKLEAVDERIIVHSVDYSLDIDYADLNRRAMQMNENHLVLFIGLLHVFVGTPLGIIETLRSENQKKVQKSYNKQNAKLFKCVSAKKTAFKFASLQDKKTVLASKILFNSRRANVYFDFETTYDDLFNTIKLKGVKQREGLTSYEQVEFAYSLVIDIKIKFRQIIESIHTEMNIKNIEINSKDLVNSKEDERSSFWGIGCAERLLDVIVGIQYKINESIQIYNQDLFNVHKYLTVFTQSDMDIKQYLITNEIHAYSYNGAKFDNQFILGAIKSIKGDDWCKCVSFVGTLDDMKIMRYHDIVFADIMLMTGGQSLKQFCKDMKIDDESSKKDIDMNKMKTYSRALENKDEIMLYVMNDSVAIHKIHKKFEKAIRMIIQDVSDQPGNDNGPNGYMFDVMTDYGTKMSANIDKHVYKCLRGYFAKWYTISSLSMKIFKEFFMEFQTQSTTSKEVYKFMQNSYQGGYTQAFVIGDVPIERGVFYFDYNSMYPAIMASIRVPHNLDLVGIEDMSESPIVRTNEDLQSVGLFIDADPILVNKFGHFNMQIEWGHYDLFEIDQFEFNETCLAPQFGLRTKQHGTIYPRTFNKIHVPEEDLLCPVTLFGFQIILAFRNKTLNLIKVGRRMTFNREKDRVQALFSKFDRYMYHARLQYKKSGNATMAQCVKVFINSLYGKFGEKHHDLNYVIPSSLIEDEDAYRDKLMYQIRQMQSFDHSYGDDADLMEQITVKNCPLIDINQRTENKFTRVNVTNIPMINTHVGSFVYIASLITALGRSQILKIANAIPNAEDVFYIDTDSIVVSRRGCEAIKRNKIAELDGVKLGALKNEYPLDGNQDESSIKDFVVFNKKVYQYRIGEKWINKFKGCRNANDDMTRAFQTGECKYVQKQQRFKKQNASVTIIDFEMTYKLRLSRTIKEQVGAFTRTFPYESLTQLKEDYADQNAHLILDPIDNRWKVVQQ